MQTNIQANFNHVSPAIFAKLAVMAEADGIDLEEYHEQILAWWIQYPTKLSESSPKSLSKHLNERQKKLPDINELASHNQAFIEQLMAMPKIEGHDDLFERSHDVREVSIDDLDFSKEKK